LKLIQTVNATGSSATLEFASIPQTFTDLVVKISLRQSSNNGNPYTPITFALNSSATNKTSRYLLGEGTGVSGTSYTEFYAWTPSSLATANTFSSIELYLPNYTGSTNKSISLDGATENNATANMLAIGAALWSNTAAITGVSFTTTAGNFVTGSTASLYGVLKGTDSIVTTSP
jgi:hypothetical protein